MIRSKQSLLRLLKKTILILLSLYLILCALLFIFQDKFIFALAYNNSTENDYTPTLQDDVQALEIPTQDGCILQGYWLHPAKSHPANLLFYFGANAEDISTLIPKMAPYTDWSIVLMYYRGYGNSEGKPSDTKLYQDSQTIYDYIIETSDISYQNIIIMGRSIGSSVATYLASAREQSAVILVSPFDSLDHVVTSKCPVLPTNLLLKHHFPSIKYAPNVTSPVYILAGSNDLLVPTSLTHQLAASFGGDVTYTEVPDVGHNTIDDVDDYWSFIQTFLDKEASE